APHCALWSNEPTLELNRITAFEIPCILPPPVITALVVDDANGGTDTGFSAGDTITVRFSEATNQPFSGTTNSLTNTDINNLFTFSPTLPLAIFTGTWLTPSTLVITTVTPDPAATIGGLIVTVKSSAGLTNAEGTSAISTATSPPLSGSFGVFTTTQTIASQETATTTLPTGQTLQVTTPAGSTSETITITRDTATESPNLAFLGNVVDITTANQQCDIAPGCTILFTFDESDLVAAGIASPTQAVITHDKNNDGDFDDTVDRNNDGDFTDCGDGSEILATNVTPTTPPGPFNATATDCFTSKFAVGGIRALFIGGGGGGATSPPSFSGKAFSENEYPLTINGAGFKLDQFSNTIPTVSL
ncbi:MAG: hypothetical protein ACRD32_08530, partial [Nitrososphaerales archaeon]